MTGADVGKLMLWMIVTLIAVSYAILAAVTLT